MIRTRVQFKNWFGLLHRLNRDTIKIRSAIEPDRKEYQQVVAALLGLLCAIGAQQEGGKRDLQFLRLPLTFERQGNPCCLISLVKAIRVRVQSLANSLVVRNPDHFFKPDKHGSANRSTESFPLMTGWLGLLRLGRFQVPLDQNRAPA